ncbi:hypothetical protein EYF80_062689 [Liparis tanakae]|uniref:Uncharacterized protein n=1 Tax=Liparis tanakae TaxID=230148 RepID=A0A4Z2EEG8_9TELE|nr:hypothetical protein EYF80_062689 [Liparis tanakae]
MLQPDGEQSDRGGRAPARYRTESLSFRFTLKGLFYLFCRIQSAFISGAAVVAGVLIGSIWQGWKHDTRADNHRLLAEDEESIAYRQFSHL